MKLTKIALAISTATILSACGGGGSTPPPQQATPPAPVATPTPINTTPNNNTNTDTTASSNTDTNTDTDTTSVTVVVAESTDSVENTTGTGTTDTALVVETTTTVLTPSEETSEETTTTETLEETSEETTTTETSEETTTTETLEETTTDTTPVVTHPAVGTVLGSQCDGTTLVETLADGQGGSTTQNTENNESCGYVHPPALGTVLGSQCDGTTLVETLADGQGGETTENTENSYDCGYVDPPENDFFSLHTVINLADYPIKEHCLQQEGITLENIQREGPKFEQMLPANINNDGFKDFIGIFTCTFNIDLGDDRNFHYGDHISYVIPYVSDASGNYTAQPYEVFGEDFPVLEAMSRRYTVADFNGDGREDYALAINWDDGRGNHDVPRQAVLMSQPNHRYEIQYITTSQPLMAHSLSLANNQFGGQDIVWGAYGGGPNIHVWRHTNDTWVDVSSEYPQTNNSDYANSDWGTEHVSISANGNETTQMVAHRQTRDNNQIINSWGLNLWEENNGSWEVVDYLEDVPHAFISYENWSDGSIRQMGITYVNGRELWISQIFTAAMCQFQDNGSTKVLAFRGGYGIRDNGTFDLSEVYNNNHPDLENVTVMDVYGIDNGELTNANYVFNNLAVEESGNYYECRDVNNDGKVDVVHETFSGTWRTDFARTNSPQVYINQGNGEFTNIDYDTDGVFIDDNQQNQFIGKLHDVNGDGIEDLIRYSLHANNSQYNESSIRIYFGKTDIN